MLEVNADSLEGKALKVLFEVYPITVDELADELHVREDKVRLAVSRLAQRGVVSLDVLPDKTFIRLVRRDIRFIGRKESQRIKIKHKRDRKAGKASDYDGHMFG